MPTELTTPWEITYDPDDMLWITEAGGNVSRVDPATGEKNIVYTAPDFFSGSPLEQNPFNPSNISLFKCPGIYFDH